jgi:hypothetical protein
MPVVFTERIPLSEFGSVGIRRNRFEDELANGVQQLGLRMGLEAFGVGLG